MGGIADYSGALVLQLPLGRVTTVSAQRSPESQVEVRSLRGGAWAEFRIDAEHLVGGPLRDATSLAAWFAEHLTKSENH